MVNYPPHRLGDVPLFGAEIYSEITGTDHQAGGTQQTFERDEC